MPLRHWLFSLRLQLDRLQPRERLLLLCTLVLTLGLLTQAVLWTTGFADHTQLEKRLNNLRNEFTANQNALLVLEQARNNPAVKALSERNQRLNEQLEELDNRVSRLTHVLIPPQTMATLLRQMLSGNRLQLKSLSVEPAERIQASDDEAGAPLYRHRLVLELSGSYSALEGYLKSIEALPWQLFWDELSVETHNYPTLNIRLRVHTLSDQEVWLNV